MKMGKINFIWNGLPKPSRDNVKNMVKINNINIITQGEKDFVIN